MIKGDIKSKSCINITTKGLLRKQIIIPINDMNKNNFMRESSAYVTNMNRVLKNIKTDVIVDFVQSDSNGIIIITNKVVLNSEVQTIENYVKNTDHISTDSVEVLRLFQSKFYFKIIGIFFFQKNINTPINSSIVEDIIKKNHIFNNITLVSKPHIIKILSKSDMAIIWINIWNVKSGSKVKGLINRCFNVGSFIVTIRGTNMNLNILQCKNCWR